MRFADIKEHDEKKLRVLLAEKQGELEHTRFGVAAGSGKQVRRIRVLRRDIAQIATALYTKTP